MKAVIKKQQSRLENSLVIYVNNKKQVNRMMLSLIESGFTVNYEGSDIAYALLHQKYALPQG